MDNLVEGLLKKSRARRDMAGDLRKRLLAPLWIRRVKVGDSWLDPDDGRPLGVASTVMSTRVPPGPETPLVEVVRSARRRRTVSAYRDGDRTVVLIPARMSKAEENRWVTEMLARLARQDGRTKRSDADLLARATELSRRYLAGLAVPASVRWVDNQRSRWGSCTPSDRSIRLSRRLEAMPAYVVDYVLLHELAHLRVPGHGAPFWAELASYPRLERARGYLEGVAAAAGLALSDDDGDASGIED